MAREPMKTNLVERVLYRSGIAPLLNSDGLLSNLAMTWGTPPPLTVRMAVDSPGGILLAEGGMGKTTCLKQLEKESRAHHPRIFFLGEYSNDPEALRTDVSTHLSNTPDGFAATLLFDGLDEAQDLTGAVIRLLRNVPKNVHVWISSRDVAAVRTIQSAHPQMDTYALAPLSEANVADLAIASGLNADDFLKAARERGILPIRAKPMGCNLALSVFQENGLREASEKNLWTLGLMRLCDETPASIRRTRHTPDSSPKDIFRTASWIALCLSMTESQAVWTEPQSHKPASTLGSSEISSKDHDSAFIDAALTCGLFTPLGDGRIAFFHSVYQEYLTAVALKAFVDRERWHQLLFSHGQDAVIPHRAGVAMWLALQDTEFLGDLAARQPELLLRSADLVTTIGPELLCKALLNSADRLSYRQRLDAKLRARMSSLRSPQTLQVLRTSITESATPPEAVQLAIAIAEECDYIELADSIAKRIFDQQTSHDLRVDAAYALARLRVPDVARRVKALLPIPTGDDQRDELKGALLQACWPENFSPTELVQHLTPPENPFFGGSYSSFLANDLPRHFFGRLSPTDAPRLLTWAIPYLSRTAYVSLRRIASAVFAWSWKLPSAPEITAKLAAGFLQAAREHESPFIPPDENGPHHLPTVSGQDFWDDTRTRRVVLLELLRQSNPDLDKDLGLLSHGKARLYSSADVPWLLDEILTDPERPLAIGISSCIQAVLSTRSVHANRDRLAEASDVRPDLIQHPDEYLARAKVASADMEVRERIWQEQEQVNKQKQLDSQKSVNDDIQSILADPRPDEFPRLTHLMAFEDGARRDVGNIDVRRLPGWSILSNSQKEKVVQLALGYLSVSTIEATKPDRHLRAPAQAIVLLKNVRPDSYGDLPCSTWGRWSIEVLKAYMQDSAQLLDPVLDELHRRCSDLACQTLTATLRQEVQRGYVSVVQNWGKRLTKAQGEEILRAIKETGCSHDLSAKVLNDIAGAGQEDLVREHLRETFADGWDFPRELSYHKLRHLALAIDAHTYLQTTLEAIRKSPEWGKEWLETSASDDLLPATQTYSPDQLALLYLWLESQYPRDRKPEHQEAYVANAIDRVYELKTRVINQLTSSGVPGSSDALAQIRSHLPGESWLGDCVIEARAAERSYAAPVLTIDEIKQLRDRRKSNGVVLDVTDFQDLVLKALSNYEKYLQGDTPAVKDLWAAKIDGPTPCSEEDVSDHIARYFKLTLPKVVVNREVQIRRKLFREGHAGSRTDLWIQAITDARSTLTVCIEVKCNWHKEAKHSLEHQLIKKYLSGGSAHTGILVLCWFQCRSWPDEDWRRKASTTTWQDAQSARDELREQAAAARKMGALVDAVVLDCTLT